MSTTSNFDPIYLSLYLYDFCCAPSPVKFVNPLSITNLPHNLIVIIVPVKYSHKTIWIILSDPKCFLDPRFTINKGIPITDRL